MKNRSKDSTYTLVVTGMLVALVLILSLTGIGLIQVPFLPFKITLYVIPIIIGLQTQNIYVGMTVGLFFGLSSLYNNWTAAPVAYSYLFRSPFVSVLPRLLIAPAALLPMRFCNNRKSALYASAAVGSIANTVFTLSAMTLMVFILKKFELNVFFLSDIMPLIQSLDMKAHAIAIWGPSLVNAALEAVLASMICPLITLAYDKIRNR